MSKPILCVDFDGVINPYSKGWQDGVLYEDHVTDGFWRWLEHTSEHFKIVVHSSRFKLRSDIDRARHWMVCCWKKTQVDFYTNTAVDDFSSLPDYISGLEFSVTKPPALVTIDDRALTFTGDWKDFKLDRLMNFKPWNKP